MFLDVDRKYELSDALFWDTRPELVNAHKHRVQIIERVLTRGSMNEFRNILHYYGKNGVRESIKSIQYLDVWSFGISTFCLSELRMNSIFLS